MSQKQIIMILQAEAKIVERRSSSYPNWISSLNCSSVSYLLSCLDIQIRFLETNSLTVSERRIHVSFMMTEYDEMLSNTNGYESDSSDQDTDEELKEAFAAGLIKPGLNYMGEAPEKKVAKNNVSALKQKLAELQRNLPWVR